MKTKLELVPSGHRNRVRRSAFRGQAAVEFALVFLVLMLLVYGIIEVSRLVFINSAVENGAREAARYASMNPPGSNRFDSTALHSAAVSKMAMVDESAVTVAVSLPQRCDFCPVTATVTYSWSTVVPILNLGPITLQSSSTTLIENANDTPSSSP